MTYERLTMKANEKETNLGRTILEVLSVVAFLGILYIFANAFLGLN